MVWCSCKLLHVIGNYATRFLWLQRKCFTHKCLINFVALWPSSVEYVWRMLTHYGSDVSPELLEIIYSKLNSLALWHCDGHISLVPLKTRFLIITESHFQLFNFTFKDAPQNTFPGHFVKAQMLSFKIVSLDLLPPMSRTSFPETRQVRSSPGTLLNGRSEVLPYGFVKFCNREI